VDENKLKENKVISLEASVSSISYPYMFSDLFFNLNKSLLHWNQKTLYSNFCRYSPCDQSL